MAAGNGKISELEAIVAVTDATMLEMVDAAAGGGLDNYQGTALQVEGYIVREGGAVGAEIAAAVEAEESRALSAEQALSVRQDDLAQAIADEESRARETEGDTALLETTDKSSLVAAVNTVKRGGNANAQEITKLQSALSDLEERVDLGDAALEAHNEPGGSHADIRDILLELAGLPEWDSSTHTLTFTARNSSQLVVDLPIESLASGIDYDPAAKEIILIKHDGTEIRVGVSDLVDVYEGSQGAQIQIAVDSGNVIRAALLAGSVSEDELSSALVQKINGKLNAGHDGDALAHPGIRQSVEAEAAAREAAIAAERAAREEADQGLLSDISEVELYVPTAAAAAAEAAAASAMAAEAAAREAAIADEAEARWQMEQAMTADLAAHSQGGNSHPDIRALIGSGGGGGGGSGPAARPATLVVGTELAGHTAGGVDFLCTGADDHIVINSAIAALPEGGGKIIIREGEYVIGGEILIQGENDEHEKDNTVIEGMGPSTVLRAEEGAYFDYMIAVHSSFCKIADMKFICSSWAGIIGMGGERSAVTGCVFDGRTDDGNGGTYLGGVGIALLAASRFSAVSGCTFYASQGITAEGEGGTVSGCAFYIGEGGTGIYDVSRRSVYSGNAIYSAGSGDYGCISVWGHNSVFTGNVCCNLGGRIDESWWDEEAGEAVESWRDYAGGPGIALFRPGSIVTGNTCFGDTGISAGIDSIVTGNTCFGDTGISLGQYGTGSIVSGNVLMPKDCFVLPEQGVFDILFGPDARFDIQHDPPPPQFALHIGAGSDCCTVHGNILRGFTEAGGEAFTEDGETAAALPGSPSSAAALGTGGSCGFNIV